MVYLLYGNPLGRSGEMGRQTRKVTKGSLELDLCFLSFFFLLLHVILHYICSPWFVDVRDKSDNIIEQEV